MADSTSGRPACKVEKPYPTFPLFCHATGRWAKKVRGRFVYFGKVADDPDGSKALALFLDEKDALYAGRRPSRKGEHGPTVADVCNAFLDAKQKLVQAGEIGRLCFRDYRTATDSIVEHFGKRRLVVDLGPSDFARLRQKLAGRFGPVRLGNEIARVRSVFKFALDSQLIERPVMFGPTFKKPAARVLRIARARNGARMFEAEELRKILKAADVPMRAAILLGLNAALGQSDIARLPVAAVDLKSGWLDYPRPKTGVARRVPLWGETVQAIREALTQRPKPRHKADEALAFLHRSGRAWVGMTQSGSHVDRLGRAFAELVDSLGFKRPGVGFYTLRHVFQTIADEARDPVAVSAVMGHAPAAGDMASVYRERIDDKRLRAVVEVVRKWLFGRRKPK